MQFNKKLTVSLSLVVLALLSLAATEPAADHTFKNLKVLPKNISQEKLEKIMQRFNKELGVKCGFCHARSKDNPGKMDFASDDKGEKEITRHMMRMTNSLNKKYFHVKKPAIGDSLSVVTCYTCHHGKEHPEVLK